MIPVILTYLRHIAEAMVGVTAFSVLFRAPRNEWLACGISGTIGWVFYCILRDLGFGLLVSNFGATVVLTLFSRWMAVFRQMPVTVYLVPGIFALVPGAGIYYTAYYFFMEQPEMGSMKAMETFSIAGAITVGILFGSFLITGFLRTFASWKLKQPRGRKAK